MKSKYSDDHLFDIVFDIEYHRSIWLKAANGVVATDDYAPRYDRVDDRDIFKMKMGLGEGTDLHTAVENFPSIYAAITKPVLTSDNKIAACDELYNNISNFPLTIADSAFFYHSVLKRYLDGYPTVLYTRPECVPEYYRAELERFNKFPLNSLKHTPPGSRNKELTIRSLNFISLETADAMEFFRRKSLLPRVWSPSMLSDLLVKDAKIARLDMRLNNLTKSIDGSTFSSDEQKRGVPQEQIATELANLGLEVIGCDYPDETPKNRGTIFFLALRANDDEAIVGSATFNGAELAQIYLQMASLAKAQVWAFDTILEQAGNFPDGSDCKKKILSNIDNSGRRRAISVASGR